MNECEIEREKERGKIPKRSSRKVLYDNSGYWGVIFGTNFIKCF